jgi:very-short-patch-repair endonuclease
VLVLEVDGSFHMEVTQWVAGLRRDRRLTSADRVVVRASAFEVRHEPGEVARDLVALGVRPLQKESCA